MTNREFRAGMRVSIGNWKASVEKGNRTPNDLRLVIEQNHPGPIPMWIAVLQAYFYFENEQIVCRDRNQEFENLFGQLLEGWNDPSKRFGDIVWWRCLIRGLDPFPWIYDDDDASAGSLP